MDPSLTSSVWAGSSKFSVAVIPRLSLVRVRCERRLLRIKPQVRGIAAKRLTAKELDPSATRSLRFDESLAGQERGYIMRTMHAILILALLALTTQTGCLEHGFFPVRSRCCTCCGAPGGCQVCAPQDSVTPNGLQPSIAEPQPHLIEVPK